MFETVGNGLGVDFSVFWNIGKAILNGLNPYLVHGSYYPPTTSYLFSLYALFPIRLSYVLWTILNAALFIKVTGLSLKKPSRVLWLLFWPIVYCFTAGQNSLLFAALIPLLRSDKRWKAIVAATLMTLKPQIAIVVLPWFVVQWLCNDRKRIYAFVASSLLMHLFPILLRPSVYTEWFQTMSVGAGDKPLISAGIWLGSGGIPLWALLAVTALSLSLIFHRNEKISRSILTVVMPVVSFYDVVYLINVAPMKLMVPVSIVCVVLTGWMGEMLPFCLIAVTAFAYQVYKIGIPRLRLIRESQAI